MGVDRKKKISDRFVRQRDACFVSENEPDIFAQCPPNLIVNICGTVVTDKLSAGDELWSPEPEDEGTISFYFGDVRAVDLVGSTAEHIRQHWRSSARFESGPVLAKVLHQTAGLAVLRVVHL